MPSRPGILNCLHFADNSSLPLQMGNNIQQTVSRRRASTAYCSSCLVSTASVLRTGLKAWLRRWTSGASNARTNCGIAPSLTASWLEPSRALGRSMPSCSTGCTTSPARSAPKTSRRAAFNSPTALFFGDILPSIDALPDSTAEQNVDKYVEMNIAHPFSWRETDAQPGSGSTCS